MKRSLAQYGSWLFVVLLAAGCRTPVVPPERPVANIYPTLYPTSVLDQTHALRVDADAVVETLDRLLLLGPLRDAGMRETVPAIVARALSRRGYAEIDARRTSCAVRWVVMRALGPDPSSGLVVEAGLTDGRSWARRLGVSLASPPETAERSDVYGRRFRLEIWRRSDDKGTVAIRRVLGRDNRVLNWELEARANSGETHGA